MVLVFAANHRRDLIDRMMLYARKQYQDQQICHRGITALRENDLEKADVIIVMPENRDIAEMYRKVFGATVKVNVLVPKAPEVLPERVFVSEVPPEETEPELADKKVKRAKR